VGVVTVALGPWITVSVLLRIGESEDAGAESLCGQLGAPVHAEPSHETPDAILHRRGAQMDLPAGAAS